MVFPIKSMILNYAVTQKSWILLFKNLSVSILSKSIFSPVDYFPSIVPYKWSNIPWRLSTFQDSLNYENRNHLLPILKCF